MLHIKHQDRNRVSRIAHASYGFCSEQAKPLPFSRVACDVRLGEERGIQWNPHLRIPLTLLIARSYNPHHFTQRSSDGLPFQPRPRDPAMTRGTPLARPRPASGAVDQQIRQAISTCWMMLPAKGRTPEAVAREIRRLVDRRPGPTWRTTPGRIGFGAAGATAADVKPGAVKGVGCGQRGRESLF